MKRAFTLVELMIVVVVIAILLTITFRIVGVGDDASKRNVTITRMQRLENALSGYFAAFGSYPPVALHASRNVYAELDSDGVQKQGSETAALSWESVREACRAQPVAARFPFAKDKETQQYVDAVSKFVVECVNSDEAKFKAWTKYSKQLGGGFKALDDPNDVDGWKTKKTWAEVKVFQFGVLSFLLPRYLFMTSGLDAEDLDSCAQWNANNRLSSHPNTGETFGNWKDQMMDARLVKRIPSQAVCARWMPNFEGQLSCNSIKGPLRFFGIVVSDGSLALDPNAHMDSPEYYAREVHLDQNRTILDRITILDGWDNEFYYYSAPPYQGYRLWSSGSDGKTFPPWVPLQTLKNDTDRQKAAQWMADDIMYLNN